MARCLPACCEANRRRPAFPPFTSGFGPGLHVLSGGVGDGRTPVAVFPGGEWMVPGRAARSADAGPVFGKAPGPRQVQTLSGYAARDAVIGAGELHAMRAAPRA